MPDHVTIRETLEYTVRLEGWEDGNFNHLSYQDANSTKTVLREIIGRRHEPDYVLGLDDARQVHIDAVIADFRQRSGYTGHLDLFDDLVDTDKSWQEL
jgi:hypothetical protein